MHRGSVAVIAEDGRLLASAGDPHQPIFLRSSAKPFQLTPFLAAGGEKRFRLSTEEIALSAASHGGEAFHAELADGMLRKGGFTVNDLHCGAHPPMSEAPAHALVARGEKPTPLHNNCSGKHAAMLLACRLLDLPKEGYWRPDHPLQTDKIFPMISRMTGVPLDRIGIAVDGCSVPVFRVPLSALALAYARLVGKRLKSEPTADFRARTRIAQAMATRPEMVAGPGRFTTRLMQAFHGELVSKEGAEGVYAIGVPPALARALGEEGSVGIALKIDDGGERGRDAVTIETLRQLGLAAGDRGKALKPLAGRRIRNVRGDIVGELRPVFRLTR